MKTYSETTESVLKKAAEIQEEKRESAGKTRHALAACGSAAIMLALVIGAVFGLRAARERGGGTQGAQGVKITPPSVSQNTEKSTPSLSLTPEESPAAAVQTSEAPRFITEQTAVRCYEQGDSSNAALALSMLEADGYIEAQTGELRIGYYNTEGSVLRNCTPACIRERTPDIELFQDNSSAYFIRIADTLYRFDSFGGWHHHMCLWDHDKNGVDDIAFYHSWGSGLSYLSVSIFDTTAKRIKEVLTQNVTAYSSIPLAENGVFTFNFDGESIYIDRQKVEYRDGEFFIGGVNAADYTEPSEVQTEPPEATPSPTEFNGYAYTDNLAIAPEDFSFTLNWGIGGYSSYDSETGRLVKTTDTTHPDDYITEFFMSEYQLNCVYTRLMYHMDFFSLPDEYDPFNDPASETRILTVPNQDVILTIRSNGREKTVRCETISLGDNNIGYCYEAYTFYNMGVCRIIDYITESSEWQALPDYESFYE